MFLKVFITILFLFSFVLTSASNADELVLRINEKNSTTKATSLKNKHLNGDLALLEKTMELKVDKKAFGDICKRYLGLTRQYGETDRAINFFDALAEKHPQSQNVHAVSGSITHDLRKKT
ncbi:MAG: hypothetical protein GY775_14445 [Candidatus Scalindua sp.]|nr:hypothetical protein [Candidatus Scalindua sp.]